jgi:hypothetical protein
VGYEEFSEVSEEWSSQLELLVKLFDASNSIPPSSLYSHKLAARGLSYTVIGNRMYQLGTCETDKALSRSDLARTERTDTAGTGKNVTSKESKGCTGISGYF